MLKMDLPETRNSSFNEETEQIELHIEREITDLNEETDTKPLNVETEATCPSGVYDFETELTDTNEKTYQYIKIVHKETPKMDPNKETPNIDVDLCEEMLKLDPNTETPKMDSNKETQNMDPETPKMDSSKTGQNGTSQLGGTLYASEKRRKSSFSSPVWSRIHGVAAVAPALEQHRARLGTDKKNKSKKVTVHQAARQGLITELKELLEECPEKVSERDCHGLKPIHYASRYNQAGVVEVLLKYNEDKNAEANYGITPLHVAAKTNAVDVAEVLLKHGANVSSRECKQKTPLHIAARRGNIAVMKTLLNCERCNVNSTDEDKLTPLHEATAHKHEKAIKLLIEYNADIFAEEINLATAFQFASSEDMREILAYFLRIAYQHGGKPLEDRLLQHEDNEGNTALHLAVVNSQLQVAEFLLEKGAQVNSTDYNHHTPLHLASGNGDTEMVELLIGHGAQVDTTDKDFMTPCHRAALQNKHKVINILMKQGADINSKTRDQFTPLLLASSKGHTETVQFLLKNGAQIAETDFSNQTVLHVAVESGHYPVILYLLKEEHSFNLMESLDFNDQSVLHYAARNGNTLILNTLIKHGIKTDVRETDGKTPLHIAAENDNDNAIEILYQASSTELNDGDDDGKTPLMLACQAGNYKSVKVLLGLGADILIRDENFCTAVILAAREGYANIVKVLIDNYGEVNQSDKIKNTALHMACSNGHIDCIRVLLQYNADVTLKNSYGKTSLDLAIDHKQSDAAVALLKHSSWRDSMNVRDSRGFTPTTRLIHRCPEAALVVLDNCVEYSSQKKDDINFTVKFDYTYIDPGVDDAMSKNSRYFAPRVMAKHKREELLSHILVQSNLMNKWINRGYLYFYINFLIYFIYLAVLQLYAFMMPKIKTNVLDNVRSCPLTLNDTMLADPAVVDQHKELGLYSKMVFSESENPALPTLEFIIFLLILIVGLNQILLFLTTGMKYFIEVDNLLTWVMVICTIIFCVPFGYYACVNEWRAGWISCTLGWILFMGNLRGFNFIGIYFIMFGEVLKSLLKVIFILAIYLMAFSTAFAITLANTDGFKDDEIYPMTAFSMMLGEFNYLDTFNGGINAPFDIDGYIIMFIFFLIMPLALMNFLTGIAVGDIAKVESTAYISRISIFIDKSYFMEIRFPKRIQRRWQKITHTVFPNRRPPSVWQKVKEYLFGSEEVLIRDYMESGKTVDNEEKEQLKCTLRKQTSQITKLAHLQKQQQEMMKQMAEHLHIDIKLDNASVAESIRSGH